MAVKKKQQAHPHQHVQLTFYSMIVSILIIIIFFIIFTYFYNITYNIKNSNELLSYKNQNNISEKQHSLVIVPTL